MLENLMSIVNPGRFEIAMFVAFARTIGRRGYRRFVDSMALRGNEKVMDFGSGPGVMAEMIAQRLNGQGGRLTCVDISEKWIAVAKRRLTGYKNVDFVLGDIRTIAIPESSFDIIGMHLVLHDVEPQMRPGVVSALANALKQDGRIIVAEPERTSHSMPIQEIRRLFEENGMVEVRTKRTWITYYFEFKKKALADASLDFRADFVGQNDLLLPGLHVPERDGSPSHLLLADDDRVLSIR